MRRNNFTSYYKYLIRLNIDSKNDGIYKVYYNGEQRLCNNPNVEILSINQLTKNEVIDIFEGTEGIIEYYGDFKPIDPIYYTPSIEEFYVGLEYERFCNTVWNKYKYSQFGQDKLTTVFYKIQEKEIRVKYLDKDDIESLGFEYDVDQSGEEYPSLYEEHGCSNAYILDKQLDSINTCWIIYHFSDNFLTIERIVNCSSSKDDMLFRGTIKNKSELKRILEMIGVL